VGPAPELTVLVPVYNEEKNLARNLPVLVAAARACSPNYEILLVDDGSKDAGRELIAAAQKKNRRIRLRTHARNLGPGAAIPTGLFWARGQWIMLLPADLACAPAQIPDFFAARRGADLVVALRSDRADYSLARKALSVTFLALVRGLSGSQIRQFNYLQLYRRSIFDRLRVNSRGVFVTAEIILRAEQAGFRVRQFPMQYRPRLAGKAAGARPSAIARCGLEMTRFFALHWNQKTDKVID